MRQRQFSDVLALVEQHGVVYENESAWLHNCGNCMLDGVGCGCLQLLNQKS